MPRSLILDLTDQTSNYGLKSLSRSDEFALLDVTYRRAGLELSL